VLPWPDREVVQTPQLGPLVLRIPSTERITHAHDAFFCTRTIFIATRTAERDVEAMRGDRVEQRDRLQAVARAIGFLLDGSPAVDRVLHLPDDQTLTELFDPRIAERDHLGEVVPSIDVDERKRKARRPKCLLGEPQHDDRVLAAREQQHRPLPLRHRLAKDMHGFGFQIG